MRDQAIGGFFDGSCHLHRVPAKILAYAGRVEFRGRAKPGDNQLECGAEQRKEMHKPIRDRALYNLVSFWRHMFFKAGGDVAKGHGLGHTDIPFSRRGPMR